MPEWLQQLLVWLIVSASLAMLARQVIGTLRGKGSLGKCCSKGCGAGSPSTSNPAEKPQPAVGEKPGAQRIIFMPVEALKRRR